MSTAWPLEANQSSQISSLKRARSRRAGAAVATERAVQLRTNPTPAPYAMLTRHGILRERFADTLTDAVRAQLLRLEGYRVDVMQFVESKHTPRNTLLRAVRTGGPVSGGAVRAEYDDLVATWGIQPRLAELLTGDDHA